MRCPNCRLINPDSTVRCDCGYDFTAKEIKPSYLVSSKTREPAPKSQLMASEKRRPAIALLLSLLTPGLGQLYNGQLRKAVMTYLACLLLVTVEFSLLFSTFVGMIISLIISMIFLMYVVFDASYSAAKLKEIQIREYNSWHIYLAVILVQALAVYPLINAFNPVQAYRMPTGSMSPTLVVEDFFAVNKFAYGIRLPYWNKEIIHISNPKRQDIVVFRYPVDPSKDIIKRIIGLPGDTVRIQNKEVFVNEQLLSEPYAVHRDSRILPANASSRDNMDPIVVPPHSLFVMGDNRDESYDSRFWKFVDSSDLGGKALYVYWSNDRSRVGNDIK